MDKWIKCSEKLPKTGLRVMFCCKDLKKVLIGHHLNNGLFQFYGNANYPCNSDPIFIDAIYWAELPEPPEELKDENI